MLRFGEDIRVGRGTLPYGRVSDRVLPRGRVFDPTLPYGRVSERVPPRGRVCVGSIPHSEFRTPHSDRAPLRVAAKRRTCGLPSTGYCVLGTGYWVLDTGYWVLASGYWLLIYPRSCKTAVGVWLAMDST